MTSEAPKEIWTGACGKALVTTGMKRWEGDVKYIRADHAQAMVAAEREAICAPLTKDEEWNAALSYRHDLGLLSDTEQVALMRDAEWWHNALSHRIRARAPADAKAALDALLKAERVKALREAKRACEKAFVDMRDANPTRHDALSYIEDGCDACSDAILALIEKETGHE